MPGQRVSMHNQYMKPISVHVAPATYQELKALAARRGRPVAELLRQAMAEYVDRNRALRVSLLAIRPHPSGRLKRPWTRSSLVEEMRRR